MFNFYDLARPNPITRFMPNRYIIGQESPSVVPPRVSTCFTSLRYQPETMIANYQFNNGWKQYMKVVPKPQMDIWRNSPSLGRYYNYFIK